MIAVILLTICIVPVLGLLISVVVLRVLTGRKIRAGCRAAKGPTIAFLHPFALSGGGGERVLWTAVRAVHARLPRARIIIYGAWKLSSGSGSANGAISKVRKNARARFGLNLSSIAVDMVDISDMVKLVDPTRYPRFTLARQAIGMVIIGARSFYRKPASIIIDTANMSFSLMIPFVLGAYTISYIHYPTISADMLVSVARRETAVHNDSSIANSAEKTAMKIVYYKCFAAFYATSARFISHALANSSWTSSHLQHIWRCKVEVLFPPCDVRASDMNEEDLRVHDDNGRDPGLIVSVGQFRPEKRHEDQLEIVHVLQNGKGQKAAVMLVMIGGIRDVHDIRRAKKIKVRAERDKLPVVIYENASVEDLRKWLKKGTIGLHTMQHEHFGISVVELMQAGLIVVAHGSGGVAMDIVKHGVNGFLADGVENFAQVIRYILQMTPDQKRQMRLNAAQDCQRFSQQKFEEGIVRVVLRAVEVVNSKGLGGGENA